MMTPYEKFWSLSCSSQSIKSRTTFKKLDAFSKQMTDNEAAKQLNLARDKLFQQLQERLKTGT